MARMNKSNLTKLFKGFRPGIRLIHKINLKNLEKCKVLTSLQHSIVQDRLNKCAYTKTIKEKDKKDREELIITLDPWHIARLFDILEKPFNDAKVDHLGNSWEAPKPLSDEEVEKMKATHRKGKSRKDIKENK